MGDEEADPGIGGVLWIVGAFLFCGSASAVTSSWLLGHPEALNLGSVLPYGIPGALLCGAGWMLRVEAEGTTRRYFEVAGYVFLFGIVFSYLLGLISTRGVGNAV